MPTIEVKVTVNGTTSYEKINILHKMSVSGVIDTLRANVRKLRILSESEYSLMMHDQLQDKEIWFQPHKKVGFYLNNKTLGVLEYKYNLRLVKIKMRIGTLTTVEYSCSQSVDFIVASFCKNVGIKNSKEFFLMKEKTAENYEIFKNKKDKFNRLNLGNDVTWLWGSMTLPDQGIGPNETLMLERRLYLNGYIPSSSVEIDILYDHISNDVVSGTASVDGITLVKLAAFHCHIDMGDYHESIKMNFPEIYRKHKSKVIDQYKLLRGSDPHTIKSEYIIECQSKMFFGATYFAVKEINVKHGKLIYRLLSISKNFVRIMKTNSQLKHEWRIGIIRKYGCSQNRVILDFGTDKYCMLTNEAQNISFLLNCYIFKSISPCDSSNLSHENSVSTINSMNYENLSEVVSNLQASKENSWVSGYESEIKFTNFNGFCRLENTFV